MRLLALLPLLLFACNSSTPAPDGLRPDIPAQGIHFPEKSSTTPVRAAPARPTKWHIIPGKRIGQTALGDDPETLLQTLGHPDASDAAMGTAWLVWDGKNSDNTLAVFTTYTDSTMQRKAIRQIRITSPRFRTTEGLHTGNALHDIKAHFPQGKPARTGSVHRYDAVAKGISFEMASGAEDALCTAILVFPPGDSPVSYLPIPQQRR